MSGGKNFTPFSALNDSALNVRIIFSRMGKFLKSERSVFHHEGAVMMSRPDVPNISAGVTEKAAGSNQ